MVGKTYYQESKGEHFKVYLKKQGTHCLKCKKRKDNKSITAKPVVNKLMSQKSVCADCGVEKSVLEKECKPDKKKR